MVVALASLLLACGSSDEPEGSPGGGGSTGGSAGSAGTAGSSGAQDAGGTGGGDAAPDAPAGSGGVDASLDAADEGSAGAAGSAGDAGAGDAGVCPTGAVCFEVPGLVHEPTPGDEVKRTSFDVPVGDYTKIELELDVVMGPWAADPAAVRHNIFWLAHDKKNVDLYGYVNFVRPNVVLVRHGIGQAQGDKAKLQEKATLTPGTTYHFHYVYDVGSPLIDSTITAEGAPVSHLTDVPNVSTITFTNGQTIDIDMGFPGTTLEEPATYGWKYENLWLMLIP